MKFTSIKLTNVRSHKATTLNCERITIVRGANGAGKTTVGEAIKYALLGKCALTAENGAGAEDMITVGAKDMRIRLDALQFAVDAHRTRSGLTQSVHSERSRQGPEAKAWIAANIAAPDVLAAVLDSGRFIDMADKDQKALLAGALASDPVAIEEKIIPLLGLIGKDGWKELSSASQVDVLYDAAFKARAEAKKTLKTFGELTEPTLPEGCPTLEMVTDGLQAIESKRSALVAQRTRCLLAVQETNNKKRAAYVEKKNKLDAAKRTVEEMGDWVIDTGEEIDKLRRTRTDRGIAERLDSLIAENKVKAETLRTERARLTAPVQTECPACNRPYDNVIPDHSKRLAEIATEMQVLADSLTRAQEDRRKLPDYEAIARKLENHQTASPKVAAAETIIKDLGAIAEPENVPANTAELDTEIEALGARLTKGREIKDEVVRYDEQVKQFTAAKARRADLETEIGELETLVAYFSDKGPLKAKLIGGKFPGFVSRVNGVLGRFSFFCDVSLDPYTIGVAHANDDGTTYGPSLKLNQLSESQRFRFGIALQVALAETTGVKLVVIDRCDMLTQDARKQLLNELDQGKLDQAFILATGEPFEDGLPTAPGVAFIELAYDGVVTTVARQTREWEVARA